MQYSISELIRPPQVLDSRDSVRRAAGVMHASGGSRMLVVRDGRLAGSVSEQSVAAFLASSPDPDSAYNQPIDSLVEPYPIFVSASVSVHDAINVFADNGVDMLPVVDEFGGLRGMLYRGDIVGFLTNNLRPASVGGMATPLGVYLTTGSVNGGAGSLGLYLTGISLGLMTIFSKFFGDRAISLLERYVAAHNLPQAVRVTITPDSVALASTVLSVGLMLLLLRLSPLAGYHAAEHMTVHAIEMGEDLSPDSVRRLPRVHPRCGTNLLAALSIFILITAQFPGETAALLAIVVVMLGRRAIGDWMQTVFTTKRPNERQLKNGIAAGTQIMHRFRERPNYNARGFSRVWNMGFLQSAAGMSTVLFVVYVIEKLGHVTLLF